MWCGVFAVAVDFESGDLRLLAEIGFLGIGRGRSAEAAAIFAFLRDIRPAGEAGYIGSALCELSRGDTRAAEAHLRAAPQTEAVIAFLALVAARTGDRRRSNDLLADLGFMRADPAVMDIAQGAASGSALRDR